MARKQIVCKFPSSNAYIKPHFDYAVGTMQVHQIDIQILGNLNRNHHQKSRDVGIADLL